MIAFRARHFCLPFDRTATSPTIERMLDLLSELQETEPCFNIYAILSKDREVAGIILSAREDWLTSALARQFPALMLVKPVKLSELFYVEDITRTTKKVGRGRSSRHSRAPMRALKRPKAKAFGYPNYSPRRFRPVRRVMTS